MQVADFSAFGGQHVATVAVLAAAIAGMCWIGRTLRGTGAGRRYELLLSAAVWALWIGYQAYDYSQQGWEPGNTLPLQMCDLTAVFAALVFARPDRRLQSLTYFWGLALGSQAVITPDLAGGIGSMSFWAFWLYHLFVVGAGVYVVVVQGFRPRWSDLRFALLIGVLYAAVVFTINAVFDLNYGYLGRPLPERPTLLDVLGPWPLRPLIMVMLGAVGMTILWLPWVFTRDSRLRLQTRD